MLAYQKSLLLALSCHQYIPMLLFRYMNELVNDLFENIRYQWNELE